MITANPGHDTGDFYTGASPKHDEAVPALFQLPVTQKLGAEYIPLLQDALRMVCIQATIQMMGYLSQPAGGAGAANASLLSAEFLLLLVYVLLGVILYWLAVRRILAFV